MNSIFLHPAELAFCNQGETVVTVVGSCVAVCLWDQRLRAGGMCHYLLPRQSRRNLHENTFGENAIANLLRRFRQAGSRRQDLVAKVLGGAHVLSALGPGTFTIGEDNIAIARRVLERYEIPIAAQSVGGELGRKIQFDTASGECRFHAIHHMSEKARTDSRIQVLVVDDSKPIRMLLRKMIESTGEFTVIGEAAHGLEAQKMMAANRPDVVTLDIEMPQMDGLALLASYMVHDPVPTVMISVMNPNESEKVFKCLHLGAFHYFQKPSLGNIDALTEELLLILREAVRSRRQLRPHRDAELLQKEVLLIPESATQRSLVLLGASTGGTEAITQVLARLPARTPPILIAQHIPRMFSKAFAQRLDTLCSIEVSEAQEGEEALPNHAYVAPGDKHVRIQESAGRLILRLGDDEPVNRFRPSVDVLFRSAVDLRTHKVIAAVLTGMGDDGARGLLELRKHGATTIAQDERSSVVYGMPKVAKEMGGALHVLSLDEIPRALLAAAAKAHES